MTTVAVHKREGIGKYLVVYLCILALAGLQFVIAYQTISTPPQMFRRMLSVALIEAGLAVMFLCICGRRRRVPGVRRRHYNFCADLDAVWLD